MSWTKGERVETYVATRLTRAGWAIEARNYRRRGFELDIIARRSDRLICVEVKGRKQSHQVDMSNLLNPRKIQRLYRGMNLWLQTAASNECSNAEFWLCYVELSRGAEQREWAVQWMRLEEAGFLCENN